MSVIEADYEVVEVPSSGPARSAEELAERLGSFVQGLHKEAERRIGRRRELEQRWLEDLRQYHGVYEDRVLQQLKEQDKSQLFLNVTRHKTNTAAAKLSDMLFPVDEPNWSIEPTPVPDLVRKLDEIDSMGEQVEERANQMLEAGDEAGAEALVTEASPLLDEAARGRAVLEAADRSAEGMTREIDDQLVECDYASECRDAIEDMCQIGTMVTKGPVKSMRPDRRWRSIQRPDGGGSIMVLEDAPDRMRGSFNRVDPWHWFPDPDAIKVKDSDGFYERHLYKEKDLRGLARLKGFDKDAIRRLLKQKPKDTSPYWVADMRTITGIHTDSGDESYHVWEYYGALTAEQLTEIARAAGRDDMAADYEDVDPLAEVHVCIWFCDGVLLKFAEHALDTNDPIYSAACWQKDSSSIWGYGIPYVMRDIQAAICAGWRMIMDNAGLSTAPQILIDKTSVEPQDGDWTPKPRKIWLKTRPTQQGERVFETFDLPARLGDLMGIVNQALKFADDETGITQLAQGEQGAGITKTAQGMAMLMNSTNVVFRRVVKAFDDHITKPNIQRLYDWTMQWSEDESIKGDMRVQARGSSVLLVREIQAQNMLGLLMNATGNPVLLPLTKVANTYRRAVQAMQVPADDVVMSDEEIAEQERQAAQNPPPPDPEMVKLQMQKEIAEINAQTQLQIAQLTRDTKLMELAQSGNVELDKIEAMLGAKQIEVDYKERALAVELASAERTGVSAGGSV